MSWQATSWAKKTQGHATATDKLLLMVMADYADPDTWECWPSQARLAKYVGCSVRTVQRAIDQLEAVGFISTLRKGNQYQPTAYRLNETLSHAQIQAHEGDNLSRSHSQNGADDSGDKVNPPLVTSEHDIAMSPLGDNRSIEDSDPPLSDRPAEHFFEASKKHDQVTALCDIGKANGRPLNGGRLAGILARYHDKTKVIEALHISLAHNPAVIEDFMEGVLKNGRRPEQARQGNAGRRKIIATAADLEDAERYLRESAR